MPETAVFVYVFSARLVLSLYTYPIVGDMMCIEMVGTVGRWVGEWVEVCMHRDVHTYVHTRTNEDTGGLAGRCIQAGVYMERVGGRQLMSWWFSHFTHLVLLVQSN